MLHASDNDAWRDPYLAGEFDDRVECAQLGHPLGFVRWNQQVSRESVGLFFPWILDGSLVFDPDIGFAVLEDMTDLVEEGEPHVVIPLVAIAQQDHRLVGGEPLCRTAGSCSLDLLTDHDRYAVAGADVAHQDEKD